MHRFLLVSVSLASLTVAASAADLPSRKGPVLSPTSGFSWTGFYAGINGGFAGDKYEYPFALTGIVGGSASLNSSGFVGGAQVGYNYQLNFPIVVGAEADIQASNVRGQLGLNIVAPGFAVAANAGSKSTYFGTLRARVGYSGIDKLLVYATGGYAYGDTKSSISATFNGVNVFAPSFNNTNGGFVVGGGFEYAILPNWSLKTEYLYVDLGKKTITSIPLAQDVAFSISEKTKFNIVRAGLNYRF